jgi:hypothetical protein
VFGGASFANGRLGEEVRFQKKLFVFFFVVVVVWRGAEARFSGGGRKHATTGWNRGRPGSWLNRGRPGRLSVYKLVLLRLRRHDVGFVGE